MNLANVSVRHRRFLALLGGVLATVTAIMLLPAGAAAAPAPAWQFDLASEPTNLPPGGVSEGGSASSASINLKSIVTNVGGGAFPSVTITDTVGAGAKISANPELNPTYVYFSAAETKQITKPCTVAASTVTCEIADAIPTGVDITVIVPIDIELTAGSSITSEVTVSAAGSNSVSEALTSPVSAAPPSFDFIPDNHGLVGTAIDEAGQPPSAGSHPFLVSIGANLPVVIHHEPPFFDFDFPSQALRSLDFSLPPGMVVNPRATARRCTLAQLGGESQLPQLHCPAESQVGKVLVTFVGEGTSIEEPIYNVVPPRGVPAELAFTIKNTNIHIRGALNGDFRLTAKSSEILSRFPIAGVRAELWGNPSDPRHDLFRSAEGCSRCGIQVSPRPFLTMPSACSTNLQVGATASSWEGSVTSQEKPFITLAGDTESVSGCDRLAFNPSVTVQVEAQGTDTPTGLSFHLKIPQNEGLFGLASATLKKAVVHLPTGVSVNPPAANGLAACSPVQIGIGNELPAACPDASKVGTAEIITPLLEGPLHGSVYLAEQRNNPFGTLLALYLVVEGEGIVVKLPGRVDADSRTGQLTATFDNNPQLPFEELTVQFNGGNGGPRATLVTPPSCGTYTTRTELTSWASATPKVVDSPMVVSEDCGTGGFNPGFSAGTDNPAAGRYSSFLLQVTRKDGEQNLSGVTASLPEGLVAKLAGVQLCPEAQAVTGACPDGSRIGTTTVGVGAGSQPLYIPQPGKARTAVYLAGPYRGAPYSLVVKVPAQAGPFDLGTVAVRVALNIDLFTTEVTAVSDPLPQILEGIPVAYRDVRVNIDKSDFILNPTSCEPMAVGSRLTSALGSLAKPDQRFQAAGCESLGFKPRLSLSLKGPTKRSGHPSLKAVVTYPQKGLYANIARAQVGLPRSEFLDQGNLNQVCKQADLRAGTCPASTIYGHAKAWTPLLDRPLEGPVYLGVGFGYKLPALVADLNGQVRILLKGKVDTTKDKGLRNTFEAVPDAPVSRFILEMKGGRKYGLLENSENICRKPQRASVEFRAQNGKAEHATPLIANSCKRKGTKRRGTRGA